MLFADRVTVDELANFFDKIPQEETSVGTIQKSDGNLITIKDLFKAYHHNKSCIYYKKEMNIAEADFFRIYGDALFIVYKAKNEKNLIERLGNIQKNWSNVTVHDQTSENTIDGKLKIDSNDMHTDERGAKLGSLEGHVDSSKFSDVEVDNILNPTGTKILEYLDPNTKERRHVVNIEGGKNVLKLVDDRTHKTDNTDKGKLKFTVTSSNTSKDIREFLATVLPQLRNEFLSRFNSLFLW